MFKYTLAVLTLLGGAIAVAATPPPAPQSHQQTSRASARQQMAACQAKAKQLKGAAKEKAIQDCMRGL